MNHEVSFPVEPRNTNQDCLAVCGGGGGAAAAYLESDGVLLGWWERTERVQRVGGCKRKWKWKWLPRG